MKNILFIPMLALMLLATPVLAQEDALPEAGSTPASPFYFAERFFEGIGTFFTFGNSAKAERYLTLAEERLAEAKVLAEDGDERAQEAVERYEEQFAEAKERAERKGLNAVNVKTVGQAGDPIPGIDLLTRVTDATTKHLTVLDDVLERVPEQAKASIQAAKERSMTGQIEALRGIAKRDPERAVDIFARAAEGRLMAAQARANNGGDEQMWDIREALDEFEQYAEFGKEISGLAGGLQSGETTVEELVERATSRHLEILQDVQSRVPAEAQDAIQRARLQTSDLPAERVRPATPAPTEEGSPKTPGRSIPENSIERTDSGSETGEVEVVESSVGSDGTLKREIENEGGPTFSPPGIPAPVPR